MTLKGFPAVLDPRALDLRAVQSTIAAIRERLRVIDLEVNAMQGAANSSTLGATVTGLQQQSLSLRAQITALSGTVTAGDTFQLLTDETVNIGMPLVPTSNGRCRIADPTDPTAIYSVLGLAATA